MDNVERIIAAVKEINELIDESHLEPDPGRSDWNDVRDSVKTLRDRAENEIVEPLKAALAELETAEDREALRSHASVVVAETGALMIASGQATDGQALVTKAVAMAPPRCVSRDVPIRRSSATLSSA